MRKFSLNYFLTALNENELAKLLARIKFVGVGGDTGDFELNVFKIVMIYKLIK